MDMSQKADMILRDAVRDQELQTSINLGEDDAARMNAFTHNLNPNLKRENPQLYSNLIFNYLQQITNQRVWKYKIDEAVKLNDVDIDGIE